MKMIPIKQNPIEVANSLTELWSPKVIGDIDDSFVKVAKIDGEFPWHAHDDEDELFYILSGQLRMDFEDSHQVLNQGEMLVVPKGVRHRPVAERECLIMLIEKKSTLHTGGLETEFTKSIEEQLG